MTLSNGRVLCLEDDKDSCDVVSLLLDGADIEVVFAGTVNEATRLMESESFDLLLVDERLPDGSGMDFCQKVRESGSIIPIVFHSAAGRKADVDAAMQAGANDYLIKPNGWAKLVDTVIKHIEQYRSTN